jgi:predicted negative regulator of RcsB-dependent stress response
MKDNVSTPVLVGVIVVVVLVLGLIGWQVFGSHAQQTDAAQQQIINARKKDKG